MTKPILAATALTCALAAAGAARAHHSFAMFDNTKEVSLPGVVKAFQWTNPHTWIEVTANAADWNIEAGSPNLLRRSGWSRDSLKPGDKVTVVIHPLKDGTSGGSLMHVVLASGETLGSR